MKKHAKWALPLLFLIIITPFTPSLDLFLSSLFYTPIPGTKGHFVDNAFTQWMFHYGERIGFAACALGGIFYILSFFVSKLKKWRRGSAAFVLTLVLGAGILVNGILKETWGRPRPKQVIEFGGKHPFKPFYRPHLQSKTDPQKSFPSGHVTMGFCYISLCLIGRRYKNLSLWVIGCFLTSFMGISLAATRLVQGGHFFSDILCAALFMWWTALLADWLVFESPLLNKSEPSLER